MHQEGRGTYIEVSCIKVKLKTELARGQLSFLEVQIKRTRELLEVLDIDDDDFAIYSQYLKDNI